MLDSGKFWLFVIGLAIFGPSLFGNLAKAAGVEERDLFNSRNSTPAIESVHIKVTNKYGKVLFTDFKTSTDNHIDFDLQPLPIGDYSVEANHGNKLINTTDITNVSSSKEVLTVDILNSKGNQVYESTNPNDSFDLTDLKSGYFTINVYQGAELINTRKVKN